MGTHRFNRHTIWTVFVSLLVALGLGACSDVSNAPAPPTPLSPDAKLSDLTVSSELLQPGFSTDTLNYTVDVLTSVTSVRVAASPQNATATRTINGVATPVGQEELVLLGAPGSTTTILIVVTAQNKSQNTYIVTVNRFGANNANLLDLTVTPGSLTGFTSNNTGPYTVDEASTVGSVTVTATKADINATVSINGVIGTSRTITLLAAPSTTPVNVLVVAQDGTTSKTYVVNVNRLGTNDANLSNLTVTPGSLTGFTSNNTGPYTVDELSTVGSVTVTATKADTSATVSINGVIGTSRTITLPAAPSTTQIDVLVIAQDGTTSKTYVVNVNRL